MVGATRNREGDRDSERTDGSGGEGQRVQRTNIGGRTDGLLGLTNKVRGQSCDRMPLTVNHTMCGV